jgi:hypothetical protein
MRTLKSLLVVAMTACSMDQPEELQVSETVAALNSGLGDPCLSEAADSATSPQAPYLGVATPTSWNWLHYGACTWYVTEYKTSGLQAPPLYIQTTLEAASTPEATCTGLSIHERVYVKRKPATDWTYVGEASRGGIWENGACEMRLDHVSEQNVVPAGTGATTVRILATARHSIGIPRPIVRIDDAAIPEAEADE